MGSRSRLIGKELVPVGRLHQAPSIVKTGAWNSTTGIRSGP
jgi:hypothetical protein